MKTAKTAAQRATAMTVPEEKPGRAGAGWESDGDGDMRVVVEGG